MAGRGRRSDPDPEHLHAGQGLQPGLHPLQVLLAADLDVDVVERATGLALQHLDLRDVGSRGAERTRHIAQDTGAVGHRDSNEGEHGHLLSHNA